MKSFTLGKWYIVTVDVVGVKMTFTAKLYAFYLAPNFPNCGTLDFSNGVVFTQWDTVEFREIG